MPGSSSHRSSSAPRLVESAGRVSLSRRVEVWDQAFVRLRLDLGLPEQGRAVDYLLELYLYFPGTLDVNRFTLSREDFYRELHTYLSLELPDLGVQHLRSGKHPDSPYRRLLDTQEQLAAGKLRPATASARLVEEAKVFGCLAHTFLRDSLERFRPRLLDPGDSALDGDLEGFAADARRIPHAYREVQAALLEGAAGELSEVTVALEQVDEYLSHQTGKVLSRLVQLIQQNRPDLPEARRAHLLETMVAERAYRETRGFHRGSSWGASDGSFLHHIELLEAAVESAMYLNQRREAASEWYSDWIGAFAAAIAMSFAFLAASIFNQGPAQKLDLWVMAIVVVTYIFKDRIKDVVKRRLTSDRRGWFPDLDTRILDRESGAAIGRSLETARWMTLDTVAPEIERVRGHRSLTYRELREATSESVLRYTKKMTLYPDRVFQAHDRRGNVVETISLGLKRILRAARPGEVGLLALTPEGDGIREVTGHRQYVINLIARYWVPGNRELYEKIRIYADEHGPVRVETVVAPCTLADLEERHTGPNPEEWVRPKLGRGRRS